MEPSSSSSTSNSITMNWWTSPELTTAVFSPQQCTWEEAEKLGDKATKAPVLYSNVMYPFLKEQYPLWEDRLQVIYSIWRKLKIEQKVFYAQKARDNRRQLYDEGGMKENGEGDVNSDLAEIEGMLSNLNV